MGDEGHANQIANDLRWIQRPRVTAKCKETRDRANKKLAGEDDTKFVADLNTAMDRTESHAILLSRARNCEELHLLHFWRLSTFRLQR
jgi:hypothetical protein